jgi:transposase
MERDVLRQYLAEGMSLEQIGRLIGKHPSTVGYWVSKHGMAAHGRAKHASKGGLPRDELRILVEQGNTLAVIAERFDVSITTVRYWIKRHGLPRPQTVRREAITQAIESGRRTLFRECRTHGWTTFVIENGGRARCRQCRMDRVAKWRRRTKAKLVEEAGGCCRICGYDRCLAALQFHHKDPTTKSFALSLRGVTRSLEQLREEAKKCVLVCANCHAAVEVGHLKLDS